MDCTTQYPINPYQLYAGIDWPLHPCRMYQEVDWMDHEMSRYGDRPHFMDLSRIAKIHFMTQEIKGLLPLNTSLKVPYERLVKTYNQLVDLDPVFFAAWRKGNSFYRAIEWMNREMRKYHDTPHLMNLSKIGKIHFMKKEIKELSIINPFLKDSYKRLVDVYDQLVTLHPVLCFARKVSAFFRGKPGVFSHESQAPYRFFGMLAKIFYLHVAKEKADYLWSKHRFSVWTEIYKNLIHAGISAHNKGLLKSDPITWIQGTHSNLLSEMVVCKGLNTAHLSSSSGEILSSDWEEQSLEEQAISHFTLCQLNAEKQTAVKTSWLPKRAQLPPSIPLVFASCTITPEMQKEKKVLTFGIDIQFVFTEPKWMPLVSQLFNEISIQVLSFQAAIYLEITQMIPKTPASTRPLIEEFSSTELGRLSVDFDEDL